MPKHIPIEAYIHNPYEACDHGFIHRDVVLHDHSSDTPRYLLPVVFIAEKGTDVYLKYPGSGVVHFIHGEAKYEDLKNPRSHVTVTAGSVVHIEEGITLRWHCNNPAGLKGFGVFNVPVSVKGFEDFIVVPA
ncbi:hypothetical protein JR316_0011212 [Psilocybe cubensis]|uniref:Uncharacterized protein n=2 Tax=Psilocybe cubensis TaxID=181762 RepID=A0A8H7XU34_PSICU|nr:hypothetical protein JR316_0011212 [Psilocybe cubensis]KAH9475655.1 hypothetical protein JR316_0011212 [Psilocybe cubensis]